MSFIFHRFPSSQQKNLRNTLSFVEVLSAQQLNLDQGKLALDDVVKRSIR